MDGLEVEERPTLDVVGIDLTGHEGCDGLIPDKDAESLLGQIVSIHTHLFDGAVKEGTTQTCPMLFGCLQRIAFVATKSGLAFTIQQTQHSYHRIAGVADAFHHIIGLVGRLQSRQ